jgi:hypothetical protein
VSTQCNSVFDVGCSMLDGKRLTRYDDFAFC